MHVIHVVQAGETLTSIAQRYGVSVDTLTAVNRPPNPDNLVVGQTLVIILLEEPVRDTVRPGDTLYRIALIYGVTVAQLAEVNQITNPNLIYPGQVLIIPGYRATRYTVSAGDTLYLIARRFGSTVAILARVNNLADPNLINVGQVLILPQRVSARRTVVTNGFYFPVSATTARRVMSQLGPYLTYLSIFDVPVDGAGGVRVPTNLQPLVTAALANGVQPLMTLTNFDGGAFSSDLARRVMSDADIRARTIIAAVDTVRAQGMTGITVDFENMYPEDRPLFNQFMADLREATRAAGMPLLIAMAPKASDRPTAPWVGTFDYATLGQLVDYANIMTYEWGWIGGPPMAIAPIGQVRAVLQYAAGLIPREKIIQGVPLYGYNWELPDTPENLATTMPPQEAISLASRFQVPINYDEASQAPTFRYTNAEGVQHEVWFEDARSIEAKYNLNTEFALGGFGYWNLAYDFPQNWALLGDMFTIRKQPAT